jgi:hypothetical protein
LRLFLSLVFALSAVSVYAQEGRPCSVAPAKLEPAPGAFFDLPGPAENSKPNQTQTPGTPGNAQPTTQKPEDQGAPVLNQQPQRILGIMPNFRAVSAGTIPPPPTPKQAFIIATRNSFDYSSFIFVGVTSLLAEAQNTHSQLGKGVPGFWRYSWRGFVDKADGNYLVIFALPTVFHQDERYFAMGHGGFWKRFSYAMTRVVITPNYQGHNSFNASELLGRGIAQGISTAYYPSKTRTVGAISAKYGYAILRDASTNAFREFWPDIAVHVLHRHP